MSHASSRNDRPRPPGVRGGLAEEMTRRLDRIEASRAAATAAGTSTEDYRREIAELEERLRVLRAGDDLTVQRWELPKRLRFIVGGREFRLHGDTLVPLEPHRPAPIR